MQVSQIGPETLRSVMRRVPSPVTVVTATGDAEARGATIGSFTSVSLEPPLVSINVGSETKMHDVLKEASRFAVHLLGDEQSDLSIHFAVPNRTGDEQLAAVPHSLDEYDVPILEEAQAVLHCRCYDDVEAGDHSIFIGEVVAIEKRGEAAPLLYYNSSYRSVAGLE